MERAFLLAPGANVGAYRVRRPLGRGGMAEVYEVEHAALGTRLALKLFTGADAAADDLKRRFLAEGKLLARLDHPRVVHVYDLGLDDARALPYFTMDLVLDAAGEPRTLERVRREGGVTEEAAARWFADLADGLAYIHAQGVVHRDVKLENVLVDAAGRAVLSDFGVSRIFNRDLRAAAGLTSFTMAAVPGAMPVMGTLGYLAPEVKLGAEAAPESDLYAFGVLMFRLLTGIWYEPDTDAFSLLEPFSRNWPETLLPLLDPLANERFVPPPPVPARPRARRWAALGGAAAAAILLAAAAYAWRARARPPQDGFDDLFGVPADYETGGDAP